MLLTYFSWNILVSAPSGAEMHLKVQRPEYSKRTRQVGLPNECCKLFWWKLSDVSDIYENRETSLNFLSISVPADGLSPVGIRPSTGTVTIKFLVCKCTLTLESLNRWVKLSKFPWNESQIFQIYAECVNLCKCLCRTSDISSETLCNPIFTPLWPSDIIWHTITLSW